MKLNCKVSQSFTFCVLILLLGSAQGAPGDLDLSFGGGTGMVRDAMAAAGGRGQALVIDAEERIVIAGSVFPLSPVSGDFGLLRLMPDGSPDVTFGSGGRAIHNAVTFPNGSTSTEEGYGLALQADGKLVIAGSSFVAGPGNDFAALRLNNDGSADTGFGNSPDGPDGWMLTNRPDTDVGLAVSADGIGGFLLAGYVGAGGGNNAAGLRLDPSGVPDPLHGNAGYMLGNADTISFTSVTTDAISRSVFAGAAESGGGGMHGVEGGSSVAIVQRFNIDGLADPAFGGDGRVDMSGFMDKAGAVRVLANGRILVGGFRGLNACMVRLNEDGSIDPGFATGGVLELNASSLGLGQMFLNALAIDDSGRIVAVGNANSSGGFQIFVLRSTADGQLDSGFGSGGLRLIDAAGDLRGNAVAIQADGAILVAGSDRGTPSTTDDQFLVVRLQGGPELCDQIFAHDFDGPDAVVCGNQP